MKEKCDRKCETCDGNQRSFCVTQMMLAMQDRIEQIKSALDNKADKVVIMPIGNEDGKSDNV